MSARRFGLSTTAIHGVPHRRPDWSPGGPRAAAEQHLRESRRQRRRHHLQPLRQQPDPAAAGQEVRPARGRRGRDLPRERHGRHRARPPGRGAPRRAPDQQQLDLRRHPASLRRGAEPVRDRHHVRATRTQPRLWRKSVRKATRAIFVETPTNPLDAGGGPGAGGPRGQGVRAWRCWWTPPSPARSTSGRSSTARTWRSPAPPST